MKKIILAIAFCLVCVMPCFSQETWQEYVGSKQARIDALTRRHEQITDDFTERTQCRNKKRFHPFDCPIELSFGIKNDKPTDGLLFNLTYCADDWIYWEEAFFIIDGRKFHIKSNKDPLRRVLKGMDVDVSERSCYLVLPKLAKSYAQCKDNEFMKGSLAGKEDYEIYKILLALYNTESDVKIRFEGERARYDITLKPKFLKPFKETFEYYHLLSDIEIESLDSISKN